MSDIVYYPNPFAVFDIIFIILGVIVVLAIIHALWGPSRSRIYREQLADMYVVGKIKKFADEDGIDINQELVDFAKSMKMRKIDVEALDKTIERELQERVSKDTENKVFKQPKP